MSDTDGASTLTQIWNQLRTKSWYWLFRKHDLVRGIGDSTKIALAKAQMDSKGHLELQADPTLPGTFEGRMIELLLRINDSGNLSITTACGSCTRAHCWHAAAMLDWLSQAKSQAEVARRVANAQAQTASEGDDDDDVEAPIRRRPHPFEEARKAAPSPPPILELLRPEMQPVLVLKRIMLRDLELDLRTLKTSAVDRHVAVAIPMLQYEGCDERFLLSNSQFVSYHEFKNGDGQKVRLHRDRYRERSLLTEIRMSGLEPLSVVFPEAETHGPVPGALTSSSEMGHLFWAHFLEQFVPVLTDNGWNVEVAEDFGHRILQPNPDAWFTDLEEGDEGRGWFSLDLGVEIEGRRISLVPVLSRALEEGLTVEVLREEAEEDRRLLLALDEPGDPVVEVPARRLLPLVSLLTELMSMLPKSKGRRGSSTAPLEGKLRLDRLRAAQLSDIEGLEFRMPKDLEKLRERLRNFQEMQHAQVPPGLNAELRAYQQDGLSWLQFLREFELHGILADDMGLGKTLQTITHLLLEKQSHRADRPSLVIAPTSVVSNWAREVGRFAPALRVLVLHGQHRHHKFGEIAAHDVVITSFPLLVRDQVRLIAQPWHVVALDEAQNIKNPRSQAAQAARLLNARQRLCLTGTPMENHLGELWSLFEFLMPGFLGASDFFRRFYRNPIERKQDTDRQAQLARRLQPLLLRRTKDAVAKDLPPKTEIIRTIDLEGPQADLYETIRAMMDQRVREAIASQGLDRSHIIVLDALLKLRQVCCHPALLKMEAAQAVTDSAKTGYLMDQMLPELLEEGRRILIFSQFTEMLAILEGALKKAGIEFVKLTGDTRDRDTPVRRFQALEVPVFLISLKAGGSGLNLTAADTVIHYDPWWNPAAEAQASDRAHRIGQTKPVFIHKLICANTIEEKIVELQREKAALLEGLLTGRADKLRLTQEDVQNLLESPT